MTGANFLLDELCIVLGLLTFCIGSYTLLLYVVLRFRVNNKIQQVFAVLQLASLSCTPLALTVFNRVGLTNDAFAVRFLEEVGLYALRYRYVLRPVIAYVGAWIDADILFKMSGYQEEGSVHERGLERCASAGKTFWTSIFVEEHGPITFWRVHGSQSILLASKLRSRLRVVVWKLAFVHYLTLTVNRLSVHPTARAGPRSDST